MTKGGSEEAAEVLALMDGKIVEVLSVDGVTFSESKPRFETTLSRDSGSCGCPTLVRGMGHASPWDRSCSTSATNLRIRYGGCDRLQEPNSPYAAGTMARVIDNQLIKKKLAMMAGPEMVGSAGKGAAHEQSRCR